MAFWLSTTQVGVWMRAVGSGSRLSELAAGPRQAYRSLGGVRRAAVERHQGLRQQQAVVRVAMTAHGSLAHPAGGEIGILLTACQTDTAVNRSNGTPNPTWQLEAVQPGAMGVASAGAFGRRQGARSHRKACPCTRLRAQALHALNHTRNPVCCLPALSLPQPPPPKTLPRSAACAGAAQPAAVHLPGSGVRPLGQRPARLPRQPPGRRRDLQHRVRLLQRHRCRRVRADVRAAPQLRCLHVQGARGVLAQACLGVHQDAL